MIDLYSLHSKPVHLRGYKEAEQRIPSFVLARLWAEYAGDEEYKEVEPLLALDPYTAARYVWSVTGHRFMEAEPGIAATHDPWLYNDYFRYSHLRVRSATFEHEIEHAQWANTEDQARAAYSYVTAIQSKGWPNDPTGPFAFKMFITSPARAFNYVVYSLEERWLEAEPMIKQNPLQWEEYVRHFRLGS